MVHLETLNKEYYYHESLEESCNKNNYLGRSRDTKLTEKHTELEQNAQRQWKLISQRKTGLKLIISNEPRRSDRYPNGGRLYGGVKNYVGRRQAQTKRDDFTEKRYSKRTLATAKCMRQASNMVTTWKVANVGQPRACASIDWSGAKITRVRCHKLTTIRSATRRPSIIIMIIK